MHTSMPTLMRSAAALLAALALAAGLQGCGGANAQTAAPSVTVVTLIDILPDVVVAGNEAAAQAILRAYVDRLRAAGESGFVSVDLLQQESGGNHFVMVEEWSAKADFDKHTTVTNTRNFRTDIGRLLGSPFDQRIVQAS